MTFSNKSTEDAQPEVLEYLIPATAQAQRENQSTRDRQALARFIKFVFGVLAGVSVTGMAFLSVAALWDWRTDYLVRKWINGPRTDRLISITLTTPTPTGSMMEATVLDPASLAYVSRLLPGASREDQNNGRSVGVRLRFASGDSVETTGNISSHLLTLGTPEGELWGGWECVTVDIGSAPPKPIADAFSFAINGSGKRRF